MRPPVVVAIFALALASGCRRSETPPPQPALETPSDTTAQAVTAKPKTVEAERAPAPQPQPTPDEPDITTELASEQQDKEAAGNQPQVEQPENPEPDVANADEIQTESPAAIEPAYRLWIPTSKGPLLVGLDLLIDEVPLRESFAEKIDNIRRVVVDKAEDAEDADAGSVSWDDLLTHVASDAMTFGQTSTQVAGQKKNLIKQYDRNKNDRADDDELLRFLFRDAMFSSEFRLFGTDAFRWSNRSASPLFSAIDRNGDRKLDRQEIESAPQSLLREIDQNADSCISMQESDNLSQRDDNAWRASRSNRHGNVAMDLSGFVNWSNLSYAMGGMIKSNPVLAESNPVSLVDANHDESISPDEAEAILTVAPAIRLTIRLNNSAPSAAKVEIASAPPTGLLESHPADSDCGWISDGGLQIGVLAIDTPPAQNRIPIEVFVQLDANKDSAIDESEIPDGAEQQFSLASLDENQDGKLTFTEINQSTKQSESIWNHQVRGRCAEHPDGVFAWLDTDHDQFLSSREIQSAPQRLLPLFDQADSIESADIPDTVMIQFGRGEPSQDDQRFQFKRRPSTTAEKRPAWAIRMDANRDGDLSQQEFLGPIDVFEKMDRNADQFLSADEITALEERD